MIHSVLDSKFLTNWTKLILNVILNSRCIYLIWIAWVISKWSRSSEDGLFSLLSYYAASAT